ncbi:hypothetical protein WA158_003255 [Blastocystis sp. Blastoise]
MITRFIRTFSSYPFGHSITPTHYHMKGVNYRSRFIDIFNSKMCAQCQYFGLYILDRPYYDRPPEWDVPRKLRTTHVNVKWDSRKIIHLHCPPQYDIPYRPVDLTARYIRAAFFVTKKKCSKEAVERNKCRRKVQYACQNTLCYHAHYGFDYGFFLYSKLLTATNEELEQSVEKCMRKLNCWVDVLGTEQSVREIIQRNKQKTNEKPAVIHPLAVDAIPNGTMLSHFNKLISILKQEEYEEMKREREDEMKREREDEMKRENENF